MKNDNARGVSLIELLVVVAIIGVIVSVSLPNLAELNRRAALRAATREVASVLRLARGEAIARGRNVAVRFRPSDDQWLYAMYIDGDFDGVRNDDIAAGIDRRIAPESPVLRTAGKAVRIALPDEPLRDPDSGALLSPSVAAVQFGVSRLCSFSPLGAGTAGSVFLTDRYNATLVRVFGATGRVRTLLYDVASRKWSER